jgi:hypothetical protein
VVLIGDEQDHAHFPLDGDARRDGPPGGAENIKAQRPRLEPEPFPLPFLTAWTKRSDRVGVRYVADPLARAAVEESLAAAAWREGLSLDVVRRHLDAAIAAMAQWSSAA